PLAGRPCGGRRPAPGLGPVVLLAPHVCLPFFWLTGHPRSSTLFAYTTLFRSGVASDASVWVDDPVRVRGQHRCRYLRDLGLGRRHDRLAAVTTSTPCRARRGGSPSSALFHFTRACDPQHTQSDSPHERAR